jgi:PAS domain S-box-containing protein
MNNVPTSQLSKMHRLMPISLWIGLCLFLLHTLLLSIPVFSGYVLALGHRSAELIYATLVLLLAVRRYRRSNQLNQQFFWLCLLLAAFVWWSAKFILVFGTATFGEEAVHEVADYAYFAFYLTFIFAAFLAPYEVDFNRGINLKQLAALLFTLACFSYFVLIPIQFDLNDYRSHYPSFVFYMMMDGLLCCLLLIQACRCADATWRKRFVLFALTFALFLVLDFFEVAKRAGYIHFEFSGLIQLPWFLPYLLLIGAYSVIDKAERPVPPLALAWLPDQLIVLTFALPLMHACGYALQLFNENLHEYRELVLAFVLLIFAGLLLYRDRWRALTRTALAQNNTHTDKTFDPDQLSFAYLRLNASGRIVQSNQALRQLLGYQADEMAGQLFGMLLARDEPMEQLLRFSERQINVPGELPRQNKEIRLQQKNGHTLPCYTGIQYLQDDSLIICITDISGLKLAEEQALSIKDKFIANITHEFRTPLTIINGALDEAIEQVGEPILLSRIQAAKSNTIRILKMVEQLLSLSKLTSAPKVFPTEQPLSEIVRMAATQFQPVARQRHISFSTDISAGLWASIADDAIQQIVANLLGNAFKYTPEGGEVSFTLSRLDQHAIMRVADNGSGITQSQQQQIFQRFQRATTDSNTFGVGIGLALVNELVNAHHWQLTLESDGVQGASFTLKLPLCEAKSAEFNKAADYNYHLEELSRRAEVSSELPPPENTNIKLLIIEDNPDMQDYLSHLMAAHYSVEVVGAGAEGVCAAINSVPDIIICDLMLPDMSGFEVVEQIKQHEVTAHIPILMLTARADLESKLEGLERKADDYLTKPFHHKELHLRLRNLLLIRKNIQTYLQAQLYAKQETGLLTESQRVDEEPEVTDPQTKKFILALQVVTEKHYAEEYFGLEEMASALALSERQLQRKMKAMTDFSPAEYLKKYRLEQAKIRLLEGDPIGIVAGDVGFSSQAYFTKCFKESYQMTPSTFLKQAKHK